MRKGFLLLLILFMTGSCAMFDELLNPGDIVNLLDTAPVLVIQSHTNYQETLIHFTFSGICKTRYPLAGVYCSDGGKPYGAVPVTGDEWHYSPTNVQLGMNYFAFYCLDQSGQSSITQIIFVTATTNPILTILSPIQGARVGVYYLLSGDASDNGPLKGVYVSADNAPFTPAKLSNHSWSTNIFALRKGTVTNKVYCIDTYGHSSVTQTVVFLVTDAPSLISYSPSESSSIYKPNYDFHGIYYHRYPLFKIFISTNSAPFVSLPSANSNWSVTITEYFQPWHTNKVYAVDISNQTSMTQTVIIDRPCDPILPSDPESGEAFGYSVAISGDGGTIAAGAPYYPYPGASPVFNNGRACVFTYSGSSWQSQSFSIKLSANSCMGTSVCVDYFGTTVGIGADSPSDPDYAYLFSKSGESWFTNTLIPSGSYSVFGSCMDISSNGVTVIVGDPEYDPNGGVFEYYAPNWNTPVLHTEGTGNYGNDIAISAGAKSYAIGAPKENSELGIVHYLKLTFSGLTNLPLVSSHAFTGQYFGTSVDMDSSGGIVVAGGPGALSGFASVFIISNYTYSEKHLESLVSLSGIICFGQKVAISGDGRMIAVTASAETTGNGKGAVYIFRQNNGTCTFLTKLISPYLVGPGYFGTDLAFSRDGSLLLVGMPSYNSGQGIVFLYHFKE